VYRRSLKGMGLTEDGPLTPGALPLEPTFLAFAWEPTHTGVPSKRRLFAGVDSCMGEVSSLANAHSTFSPALGVGFQIGKPRG